jgi:CDP-glucose 4,6-dehydratase
MEDMVKSFWSGKRVFITGHTGFKGSWLSLWLEMLGVDLLGYALEAPTTPSLFVAARAASGMRSVHGDILNASALEKTVREFAPEVVFHLASQPLVRRSYADPIGTFATNVLGTANLLESVRHSPSVRSIVVVTSDKCYENREWIWPYRETDRLGGHDPYSASKACAELVADSYRSAFFSRGDASAPAMATVRAGNVIGGGDWAMDRLLPDILRAFATGEELVVRNPKACRPWQHVLEPLHGYLMLAQSLFEKGGQFGGAWNFGPHNDDARPVEWIVRRMAEVWGAEANWAVDPAQHPHEAGYLNLDWTKARTLLGWSPRMNLESAIELTVSWHRHFLAGGDAREKCIEQIAGYMNRRRDS